MINAAYRVGLIEKDQRKKLLIITEPDAATLYCESDFGNLDITEKMTFIMCDTGGGTVNLVIFLLDTNENTGKKVICRVNDGEGYTCSSTCLDENFRDYIFGFYDEIKVQYDKATLDEDVAMKLFIYTLKVILYNIYA
jgi:hypothetical protein